MHRARLLHDVRDQHGTCVSKLIQVELKMVLNSRSLFERETCLALQLKQLKINGAAGVAPSPDAPPWQMLQFNERAKPIPYYG